MPTHGLLFCLSHIRIAVSSFFSNTCPPTSKVLKLRGARANRGVLWPGRNGDLTSHPSHARLWIRYLMPRSRAARIQCGSRSRRRGSPLTSMAQRDSAMASSTASIRQANGARGTQEPLGHLVGLEGHCLISGIVRVEVVPILGTRAGRFPGACWIPVWHVACCKAG